MNNIHRRSFEAVVEHTLVVVVVGSNLVEDPVVGDLVGSNLVVEDLVDKTVISMRTIDIPKNMIRIIYEIDPTLDRSN